jgi:uncharacterized membrane protein
MRAATYHAVVAGSYLALLALQPVWHAFLPTPYGTSSWWLGLLAALPLLFPLKGVLKGQIRSMTWAGYLLLLYLVIGVMEAWSNPPQRLPALIQTGLVAVSIAAMLGFSRESR